MNRIESQRAMVAARLATLKWGRPKKSEKETNLSLSKAAAKLRVSVATIKHAHTVLGILSAVRVRLAPQPATNP